MIDMRANKQSLKQAHYTAGERMGARGARTAHALTELHLPPYQNIILFILKTTRKLLLILT